MQNIEKESIREFVRDERCRFRNIRSKGRRVVIRLTERCDLACPHCLVGTIITREELSYNQWIQILAELPQIDTKKVLLTGGEPLLYNDVVKIAGYIRNMGIAVDLNSNLQKMTLGLMHEFKEVNLTEISVSIEGPPEIHDKMHGKAGTFENLVRAIKLAAGLGIIIDASCCLTRLNADSIFELLKIVQSLPVQSFTISRLLPIGHGLKTISDGIEQNRLTKIYHEIAEKWVHKFRIPIRMVGLLGLPQRQHCFMAESIIGLRPDGSLEACVLNTYQPKTFNPFKKGLKTSVDELVKSIENEEYGICY